jgi:hypothetical protein
MDREDHDHFRMIALAQVEQQGGSRRQLDAESSALVRDPAYTLQKAQMIFACYRKDETQDPEVYAAAVAAVLSGYPKTVIDYVCDPRTGITGTNKWLPSVSEVKESCDVYANRIAQDIERKRRIERQFKEQEEWENQVPTDRLKEKGKAWLDRTDPIAQKLSGQKAKAPLTEAQKKAALDDAALVGKSIEGMKLLPETLATLNQGDSENISS